MIDMVLVIKRIKEVEDKDDFEDLRDKFRMSGADLEDRQEAIRLLELEFPHYCNVDKRNADILKSIKDGEAELPHID
jgi:hypothetical protein